LDILRTQLTDIGAELPVLIPGAKDFESTRNALQGSGWEGIDNIAIDTATKLEEWAVNYTLAKVKTDKGQRAQGIEDYGFGKGYQYVFETFLTILGDLDKHVREGRNVILIAHDCTAMVPNPSGEDFLRYEPRLQNSKSASIRYRLKEWCDHVLFLGYDVNTEKGSKKAQGIGTRTLYTAELPHCMAKSRTTNESIDIVHGESPWDKIIK
jgi:hypothetical protein